MIVWDNNGRKCLNTQWWQPGSRPPTSRSLKEPNFKLPGRSPITSAPRQQRLSCVKLTFPGSNIGLKRWVFSRLTSGTVSMSRTRGEWSWTTELGFGFVDQTGTPLFLRPCQAWAYWRAIRGITHHPDLTHLGADHHQLPRRWPIFPVDVEGPVVRGYTGCHRRHRPNRHPGVHRWVHPRRYHWWWSRDGGYEWGDIIERWYAPTGRWCSSYQADKSAMVKAILFLEVYEDWQSVLVLFDSKSLVETHVNSNQPDGDVHPIQSAICWALQEERSSNPVGARALQPSRQRAS